MSLLLTDLYELNMAQAYLDHGMTETAVFEFFVRRLPSRRNFLMAAGLAQALEYLEALSLDPAERHWLRQSGMFSASFIAWLDAMRFTGAVDAVAEGTVVFADEPILRVVAPMPVAQLVESRVMNILHFQTLIASKAARMVLAANGRSLVDFGMRRAHGEEAALLAARAAYLAGFDGTATVAAGQAHGVPVMGTMAHSFVQANENEDEAFMRFCRSRPKHTVLLIDTYDTESGAAVAVRVAHRLRAEGIAVTGVRLDSGDLGAHARSVRRIMDQGGCPDIRIMASGGLDEEQLERLDDAPIDGYGIGSSLTTSSDIPALDCAYKLQEYAGVARRKRSEGKATWPGRKQVRRLRNPDDGRLGHDILTTEDDGGPGERLLTRHMENGRRCNPSPSLADSRAHAAAALAALPERLRSLKPAEPYRVLVSDALKELAAAVDRRTR